MKKVSPTGVRTLQFQPFIIGMTAQLKFTFTENGVDWSVGPPKTWSLFIRKNPGDKKAVIALSFGNGITIPIYDDNILLCQFSPEQTQIQEGQYFLELVRTDILKQMICGWCEFTYGPKDSDP